MVKVAKFCILIFVSITGGKCKLLTIEGYETALTHFIPLPSGIL